ncbi:chromosomal replication initiator protein DnaA [candidate division WOR-3 bacterium]|uniref:Chromosomal replication initiator protein DnaA n=1 Tax=candidate division WOR-3 bacterium TaxID=2052148 RepID=A0A9D5QCR3_UNCW3|nr:chromosomal replication initiator protein DnaA [candidate division WOR-3 bacterium]MBD3364256.1 chromosomal replication initiator protein DnaA [candidate division WOR-3 bacterium]
MIWEQVLTRLKDKITEEGFNTWFKPTRLIERRNGVLLVEVPNPFFAEWIEEYYGKILTDIMTEVSSDGLRVAFHSRKVEPDAARPRFIRKRVIYTQNGSRLQERYTFKDFIVGESNRFAHAASLAVAEAPSEVYNPLFLYGGVGLGKTHLVQAIGNYIARTGPKLSVAYIPAETLFIELIDAVEKGTRMEFKNRYRSKDILLIDDIHFLKGKESLQEEIFHLFNHLYEGGKQVVLTCDRPPREIPTLEDRLASRFSGGLVVDIQPPDLETRIAILLRKAESEDQALPRDVAYYIASRIRSNIRELEGALIKLLALSSLTGRGLTTSLADEVLSDLLRNRPRTTPNRIAKHVARGFNVKVDEMKGRRRTAPLALARQSAMYLVRKLLNFSLKEIGRYFGGKDHTTVLHAIDKISRLREEDLTFKEKLMGIEQRINRG